MIAYRRITGCFLLLCALSGCATSVRYVTSQDWHDDDTLLVAYSEFEEIDVYLARTTSDSTAHVVKCEANQSNKLECRKQEAIDALLNTDQP